MAEQQNSMFQQKYQMIINQASVREVMEEYGLKIVKKGKDFKTVCPFHDDHDPSLSIRDDKIWKCFVCNESGNAISFVQKYENKVLGNRNFTVRDAMNKVIDICHLNIPKEQNNQNSLNAQYSHNSRIYSEHERVLLNTLNKIKEIANYNLTSLGNTKAKQYLLNRGFTKDLIQELQFGYISYEQIQQWIDKKSFPLEYLLKTGFIREDEQGNYHPVFGNRILIPVMDERGNTVTFSGRAIHGEEPKYLHGRNTDIFMKSNHLYNFNVAKNYAYNDKIYVVEGFMDVAGGNKMNIRNIVATMGTSFTKEQIAILDGLNAEKQKTLLINPNDYGKIIQDMVKVAKASDNHTWFLEPEEFLDKTYAQEDLDELSRDLQSIKEAGVHDMYSIVEMWDDWKEADEHGEPVATFHGAFLDLFAKEKSQSIDKNLISFNSCTFEINLDSKDNGEGCLKWHNYFLTDIHNKDHFYIIQIVQETGKEEPRFSLEKFEKEEGSKLYLGEWVELEDVIKNSSEIEMVQNKLIELSDKEIGIQNEEIKNIEDDFEELDEVEK